MKSFLLNFFKYLVLILVLYLYIHNPLLRIINGVGAAKLLYLLPFAFLYGTYRKDLVCYSKTVIVTFIIIVYTLLHVLLGGDSTYFHNAIVALIEVVLCGIVLAHFIVKSKINYTELIVWFGIVSAALTIVCILLPDVNNFIKNDIVVTNDSLLITERRGFGLSDSLTYNYGMVMSVVFLILLTDSNLKYYYFAMPFIFLAAIVNARTGALIMMVCLVAYLCLNIKEGTKKIINILIIFLIAFFVVGVGFLSSETLSFATDLFYELYDFTTGSDMASHSSGEELTSNHFTVLPETLDGWIFGTGDFLYDDSSRRTDSGLMLSLNFGGLIYILLIILYVFSILRKSITGKEVILFSIIVVIAFLKGQFLLNTGGFRLIALYCFCNYLSQVQIKQLHNRKIKI